MTATRRDLLLRIAPAVAIGGVVAAGTGVAAAAPPAEAGDEDCGLFRVECGRAGGVG